MAARDHVMIYTTKFDIFNADIQNVGIPKYSHWCLPHASLFFGIFLTHDLTLKHVAVSSHVTGFTIISLAFATEFLIFILFLG